MAQGLGAGILWGAATGAVLVVALTQLAPVVTLATDVGAAGVDGQVSPGATPPPETPPAPDPAPVGATMTEPNPATPPAAVPSDVPATADAEVSDPDERAEPAEAAAADVAQTAPNAVEPAQTAPAVVTDTPPAPGAPNAPGPRAVPVAPVGTSGVPQAAPGQTALAVPGSETAPAPDEDAPSAPQSTLDLAAPDRGRAVQPERPDVPAPAMAEAATARPVAPATPAEPRQDTPVAAADPAPAPPAPPPPAPPAPPPAPPPAEPPAEPPPAEQPSAPPATQPSADAQAPGVEMPAPVAQTEPAPEPASEAMPPAAAPPATVRIGRLPRIGDETAPEVTEQGEVGDGDGAGGDMPAAPPVAGLPGTPGRIAPDTSPAEQPPAATDPGIDPAAETAALAAFAVPFDNPENRPVLAIVLVESDAESRPDAAALAGFPFPLTVALDPAAEDAADAMRAYRAAGVEIAAVVRFPDEATAQDVAVAWDVHRRVLSESVALVDGSQGAIQSRRGPMAQVVAELGRSGHGFVTEPQGFNAGQKLAEREGVPSALVFRTLDPADRGAMARALDQGAFRAGQDGRAVLTAPLSAATLAALAEWGLGTRQAVVSLAPLSAALN